MTIASVHRRAPLTMVSALLTLIAVGSAAERQRPEARGSGRSFTVTIREEAGIARRGEPTQVSLPFAAGVLENEADVAITGSDGKPVPAQFEVLARWNDGSIRWLLARFRVDVPANGQVALTVHRGAHAPPNRAPDLVRKEGANLHVDTGVIRAEVGATQREAFTVTTAEGKTLLTHRPQLVVYSPSGDEHRGAPPETVEVEVNGPLYASVFLAGPMKAKDSKFDDIFQYETRVHFWRGLGRILAEHTVVAIGSANGGITIVDGIVVGLKADDTFSNYVLAGQDKTHAGALDGAEGVRLKQTCAYWHECGQGPKPDGGLKYAVLEADFGYTVTSDQGRRLAEGEKSAGWLWATGAERSLGVAVRDFWEEGPKALRVAADGTLAVECYAHWQPKPGEPRPPRPRTPDFSKHPKLDEWFAGQEKGGIDEVVRRFLKDTKYPGPVRRGPFRFGKGRAKTTDVLYLFGKSADQEAETAALAAHRHHLVPVVDPRYLTSTRALPFVWLASADSGLPTLEKGLLDMFKNWKRHATRYGFLHYGDDQCGLGYNRTVPATTDDQEYDTTVCLTMQFGRTGNPDYLRSANVCARHFMDVDQVHRTGELHYHGYTASGDYHEEPVGCDMGGHPYIAGVVNHYMLTGDRRSLRGIQRVAHALRDYGRDARARLLSTDGRSIARPGICLAAIHDLTHDPAHLAPAKRMVDAINDLAGDVTNDLAGEAPFRMWWFHYSEMCYHIRELLVRYHAATGDERTLATLNKIMDLYLRDLWDSQHEAWRGFLGAPHDFNGVYQWPAVRKGRTTYTRSGYVAAEIGLPFAYLARCTGNNDYLVPFLDYLDDLGSDYAQSFSNRRFTRRQLWCLPFVSMLPPSWRAERDTIVQREVFRARLTEGDGLKVRTPDGEAKGTPHGELLWADSPFGRVLRTYKTSYASFLAPENILELPGTVSFWVRKDKAEWGRKPWPWYGVLRGLVHIGSDTRETNALDLMMRDNVLWTRLYDHRGWEMTAVQTPSPQWEGGQWHHIAVVWNRYDLTVLINGEQVGHETRFALPNGGQTEVHVGWRPTNRYGQANFHDLRIFRTALPTERIKQIYESTRFRN